MYALCNICQYLSSVAVFYVSFSVCILHYLYVVWTFKTKLNRTEINGILDSLMLKVLVMKTAQAELMLG